MIALMGKGGKMWEDVGRCESLAVAMTLTDFQGPAANGLAADGPQFFSLFPFSHLL